MTTDGDHSSLSREPSTFREKNKYNHPVLHTVWKEVEVVVALGSVLGRYPAVPGSLETSFLPPGMAQFRMLASEGRQRNAKYINLWKYLEKFTWQKEIYLSHY